MVQGAGNPWSRLRFFCNWFITMRLLVIYEQSSLGVRSLQHLAQSKEGLPFVIIMTRLAEAMHYRFNR